jgi:hypothetical protein
LAAVVALAACSKEQTIVADRGDAIGFGAPFVENSTRAIDPSYNASNLIKEFNVWGTVTGNTTGNTINLFNGARVYDTTPTYGVAYDCEQDEYWLPSATYNFVAIAGHNGVTPATGMPATISYTANGTTDLVYTKTAKVVTTNAASTPSENPVAFTFNHLLSKVHFAFYNTSATANTVFQISNIKVSGQYTSGTYTIGATTPWAATGPLAVADAWSFGNATNSTTDNAAADITTAFTEASPMTSNYARLLIPGKQTIKISFTKTQYYDGVKMNTEPVEKELTYTFAENGAYVINVELKSGGIIDFSVGSLDGWDDDTNISIP